MAQKQQEPVRKTFVTIRHGNREIKLETWRYWEIVGELQFFGADRLDAIDAAKWALIAKAGDAKKIGEIELEVTDG